MRQPDDQGKGKYQYALNLTVVGIFGQVGCLTLIIILTALFAGLWLDKYFNTKPLFTIVLMLGSMPVSLLLMYKIIMWATRRIKPVKTETDKISEEGGIRD
jgi:MFS-type transporter involved in bile tolerance (Atg22 family)